MKKSASVIIAFLFSLILTLSGCSFLDSLNSKHISVSDSCSVSTQNVADLSEIPEFEGLPYVTINNNVPYFKENEMVTTSFERYAELDTLGRCGETYACVGKDIMPTEERGEIGQIKPSGWKTVKYDIVSGKYLYNRCHLIGFQLTGENANERNLITGTRYLNIDGMLPFENMVADYVKETENHVLYRVTPVFVDDELVARGVLMEALSVEDNGAGIKYNVYCFNAQPGISINYLTGDSQLGELPPPTSSATSKDTQSSIDSAPSSDATSVPQTSQEESSSDSSLEEYVLNTSSGKFHLPTCSSVNTISESNKQTYHGTRDQLISNGYSPCGSCKP